MPISLLMRRHLACAGPAGALRRRRLRAPRRHCRPPTRRRRPRRRACPRSAAKSIVVGRMRPAARAADPRRNRGCWARPVPSRPVAMTTSPRQHAVFASAGAVERQPQQVAFRRIDAQSPRRRSRPAGRARAGTSAGSPSTSAAGSCRALPTPRAELRLEPGAEGQRRHAEAGPVSCLGERSVSMRA